MLSQFPHGCLEIVYPHPLLKRFSSSSFCSSKRLMCSSCWAFSPSRIARMTSKSRSVIVRLRPMISCSADSMSWRSASTSVLGVHVNLQRISNPRRIGERRGDVADKVEEVGPSGLYPFAAAKLFKFTRTLFMECWICSNLKGSNMPVSVMIPTHGTSCSRFVSSGLALTVSIVSGGWWSHQRDPSSQVRQRVGRPDKYLTIQQTWSEPFGVYCCLALFPFQSPGRHSSSSSSHSMIPNFLAYTGLLNRFQGW